MSKHIFHPTILRAYDIRGIYEQTLSLDDARAIGLAFSACLRARGPGKKICVGRDGRLSSPALAEALTDGLVAGGMEVFDIGCGPTPMLYFADRYLESDAAIQVTGSHNPPDHNGFKMVMGGASFFGDDIEMLGAVSADGPAEIAGGTVVAKDVFGAYIARLLRDAEAGDFNIVWDCGNGASGPATASLTEGLSGTHQVLFAEIDGTFPNHHPNPVDPETLEMLRNHVFEANADLGIGFDGDGDRIGIIDAKGRLVPGDLLTAYLAKDIISRQPSSPVIFDVKSSDVALQLVASGGGDAQIWKTGHSHMKKRMKDIGAPLAGEMSGHIFIADGYYGFDDALYVATRVITQMVTSGESITAFMDSLSTQHVTPELRIDCDDTEKFAVMERLARHIASVHQDENITLIDGVRVRTGGGWWLIRASNTEAALVARAESNSESGLQALVREMEEALQSAGLDQVFQS